MEQLKQLQLELLRKVLEMITIVDLVAKTTGKLLKVRHGSVVISVLFGTVYHVRNLVLFQTHQHTCAFLAVNHDVQSRHASFFMMRFLLCNSCTSLYIL